MDDRSVQLLLIALAVATPALAVFIYVQASLGQMTLPARSRLWMLLLAGPVNLLCWLLLKGPMEGVSGRSLVGGFAALAVFLTMGFGFGFFRRRRDDVPHTDGHRNA